MAHIVFFDTNEVGIDGIATAKKQGHYVTFIEPEDHRRYSNSDYNKETLKTVDNIIKVASTSDFQIAFSTLEKLHKKKPINALITTNEYCIEAVAEAAERLKIPFTDKESIRISRRKHLCRQRLSEKKLASVPYDIGNNLEELIKISERLTYPVVFKPTSGADSAFAQVIRNRLELTAAYESFKKGVQSLPSAWKDQFSREILIEKYISGELVSVELGVINKKFIPFMVSGRHRAQQDETYELGATMPAPISNNDRLKCIAYAIEVVKALGLNFGIFHLEMIVDQGKPVLVEANPRLMGANMPRIFQETTSVNIYESLIKIHLNDENIPSDFPVTRPISAIRFACNQDGTLLPINKEKIIQKYKSSIVRFEYPNSEIEVKKLQVIGRIWLTGQNEFEAHAKALEALNDIMDMSSVDLIY